MFKRFRGHRVDEETRAKYRETSISISDFILPLFVIDASDTIEEIPSMKEVFHLSPDKIVQYLHPFIKNGLKSVILFGVPKEKGLSQAYSADGVVQRTIPILKAAFPTLEVICDVCICSYTENGHCHVGDNDETCRILAKIAVSYAESGADAVAPSDMMDGRVWFLRKALDESKLTTPIISYAAKFASSFYGPFRDAAECAPQEGDRRGYQMDFANGNEAQEEIAADIEEGAAAIIIKPALSYLDVVSKAAQSADLPIIAYNVSGEYSMLRNAVEQGIVAEEVIYETLLSMKRAGADRIITYFVPWWIQTFGENNE